jgi:hypothetical protein
MYMRFAFEGDIHDSLECVPLSVRRKLDLAALKISLQGWQRLSRAERLTLCHLSVDSEQERNIYREVMLAFCERAAVPLRELEDANAATRAWNAPSVPPAVALCLGELGGALTDGAWRSLDEERRYALLKLSDPKRNLVKIRALLLELGLPGPWEPVGPKPTDSVVTFSGRGQHSEEGQRP